MNNLFLELIQVAIGTRDCLSRIPSSEEWAAIYNESKRQALSGICFSGIGTYLCNLYAPSCKATFCRNWIDRVNLPTELYRQWMAQAAHIQDDNDNTTRKSRELLSDLSLRGVNAAILKGQGVAALYGSLSSLRQSGDIDVWVDLNKEDSYALALQFGHAEKPTYLHVGSSYKGVPVELHYRPTYMRSPFDNRRMQRFCEYHKNGIIEADGLKVPSWNFNVVYITSHIFRHCFGLGVGLRQIMDFYYLCSSFDYNSDDKSLAVSDLKAVGLYDFAGAVSYVMMQAFGANKDSLIVPPDTKRGEHLLKIISIGGNFGHHDNNRFINRIFRSMALLRYYPSEMIFDPFWRIYRSFF